MPTLPTSWYRGRGAVSGPVIGGYLPWQWGPWAVTGTVVDIIPWGFIAPCDLRLSKIEFHARVVADGGGTLNFWKNTAAGGFSLAGATRLQTTADQVVDTAGKLILPAGEAGGADTLVELARNIARGDRVFVEYDQTVTTISVADLSCSLLFWITGHPNVKDASD